MEEVLLGVAAVFAEVCAGEIAEFSGGDLAPSLEVVLAQDALDPDVDGERPDSLVGEEQDAVGHFFADAREPA